MDGWMDVQMYMQYWRMPKEGIISLRQELQMVLSCQVGARN